MEDCYPASAMSDRRKLIRLGLCAGFASVLPSPAAWAAGEEPPKAAPAANYYPPVRPEWLALTREPALDPARPIIDPHHHLWDRPTFHYMYPDYLADIGEGHRIAATVYVDAHSMYSATGPEPLRSVGETEFASGVAAMAASGGYGSTLACAGIVGRAELLLGDAVQEVLDAHIRAGMGRFKGIRYTTARDGDPRLNNPGFDPPRGLLADSQFRRGFARLAPSGLSFDAWMFHPQLDELVDLARAFPETTIVLNHCGGPTRAGAYAGRDEEVLARWTGSMMRLGGCPNIVVKLGGLGVWTMGLNFYKQAQPPGSEQLVAAFRPIFATCLEAFGPSRCMFESDFPVDKVSFGYGVFWNACKRFAADLTSSEQDQLFFGTAARTYRLAT